MSCRHDINRKCYWSNLVPYNNKLNKNRQICSRKQRSKLTKQTLECTKLIITIVFLT